MNSSRLVVFAALLFGATLVFPAQSQTTSNPANLPQRDGLMTLIS